jgi:hypothetical protein
MSNYNLLPAHLNNIADEAEKIIRVKYGLGIPFIETSIDPSIKWSPTLHWKTKNGIIIACEVHESPMPMSIKIAHSELSITDLPVKIFIAHPVNNQRSVKTYLQESKEAKNNGFGLISVNDDNTGSFQHMGIETNLFIPVPIYMNFIKPLRVGIELAYDIYINTDPRHGVQEIGQLVESIIFHLADQAKSNGALRTGGYLPILKSYALANLIEDLMRDRVIDNAILGRCRGFVEDRNDSSHKPKSLAQAKRVYRKLKSAMLTGLIILEEIPRKIKEKGYKLKVSN